MKKSPYYLPSYLLSIVLTLLAVLTLLPLFGLSEIRTFAPLSTIGLLLLTAVNCTIRAEVLKRKEFTEE
jgi:predicted ABC-type exoprotein transport system permease subunit